MNDSHPSADRPFAPVTYCGFMEGFAGIPGCHLYNLTEAIAGHPSGSTVAEPTLRKLGYSVPSNLPSSDRNPQPCPTLP